MRGSGHSLTADAVIERHCVVTQWPRSFVVEIRLIKSYV